jgi:hypothetical protein
MISVSLSFYDFFSFAALKQLHALHGQVHYPANQPPGTLSIPESPLPGCWITRLSLKTPEPGCKAIRSEEQRRLSSQSSESGKQSSRSRLPE